MAEPEIDTDLIDEAVLALMSLTLHKDRASEPRWRAGKSLDRETMGRLHQKGLIVDSLGKAKSVVLTPEGQRRCEEAYYRLFAKRDNQTTKTR